MEANMVPDRLFGLKLDVGAQDPLTAKLPRIQLERFDVRSAEIGNGKRIRFIAAIASWRPSLPQIRTLMACVHEQTELPCVLCVESIDPSMREALAAENIAFISADGNAYLPFAGALATNVQARRPAAPLSPQAQRIFLNLLAGRWYGLDASDLAKHCNRSNASITKYLAEIRSIQPALVSTEGRRRVLDNLGIPVSDLLELFEPYLKSPVGKQIRLARAIEPSVLADSGALLSGLSALPFFSDLAHDSSQIRVAMLPEDILSMKASLGEQWNEAPWYDEAPLVIEELTYAIDASLNFSVAATGLACIDPYSLYAELAADNFNDPRIVDAVYQLRERICR